MSLPKLLIVSWYGLRDSLKHGADALGALGYNVCEYPLFRFMCDQHDKKPTWKQDFLAYVTAENPKVILWWFFDVPPPDLADIKARTPWALHCIFNWDDPFKWHIAGEAQRARADCFDIAFTCCSASVRSYLENGSAEAYTLYPGCWLQPEAEIAISESDYFCDVSFLVTNLYIGAQYARQRFPRADLVDRLAREPSIKFHLYGPAELGFLYPNHYKGYVSFAEQVGIFRKSRINLSTHLVGDEHGYLNERVSLVLGAGALLLVDPVEGIRDVFQQPEGDAGDDTQKLLILDTADPVSQIKRILGDLRQRPDHYAAVRRRGWEWARDHFSYAKWAATIHRYVGARLLDQQWYGTLVGQQFPDREAALQHWHARDREMLLPFFLHIPETFRSENWIADSQQLHVDGTVTAESGDIERRRALAWISYIKAEMPKTWLYCPRLQPAATATLVRESTGSSAAALEKMHPGDVARIESLFSEIDASRAGHQTLVPLLKMLDSQVRNSGGPHVPCNEILNSWIAAR